MQTSFSAYGTSGKAFHFCEPRFPFLAGRGSIHDVLRTEWTVYLSQSTVPHPITAAQLMVTIVMNDYFLHSNEFFGNGSHPEGSQLYISSHLLFTKK